MTISGTFKNYKEEDITVIIYTPAEGEDIVIGEEEGCDVFFSADPVEITCAPDTTLDVIIMKECQVNLVVKKYLGDKLFTSNARDIIVNVWKDDRCCFAGYLEPNVYNQPYSRNYDELQLNCTDALTTLQYYNYKNITTEEQYAAAKIGQDSVSFQAVLENIFSWIPNLDLYTNTGWRLWYDGTVKLSSQSSATSIFNVAIFEKLLLGDELDDVYTEEETLEMFLKYFDLHIRQDGLDFFIYSNQAHQSRDIQNWTCVYQNTTPNQNIYYIKPSQQTTTHREVLQNVFDAAEQPGNLLEKFLGPYVVYENNEYHRYYYYRLPDNTAEISDEYIVVDNADIIDYIKIADNVYKILEQNELGDYYPDELPLPPAPAYDASNNFKESYFEAQPNEFIITEE